MVVVYGYAAHAMSPLDGLNIILLMEKLSALNAKWTERTGWHVLMSVLKN